MIFKFRRLLLRLERLRQLHYAKLARPGYIAREQDESWGAGETAGAGRGHRQLETVDELAASRRLLRILGDSRGLAN
jgi:hypothetical protein